MWNSLVLMNDSLRQEAETLNQSVEKKGKSKDRGNSSEQSTYRCNILVKQVSDKMFSWMRTLMWHSLTSQDTNISLVLSPLRVFFDAGWVDNLFHNVLWIFIHIPINVLFKIQSVPSSGIQTSGWHFLYHHSVIFGIRIMPVWRVNFNNMPKICQSYFLYKGRQTRRFFEFKQPR